MFHFAYLFLLSWEFPQILVGYWFELGLDLNKQWIKPPPGGNVLAQVNAEWLEISRYKNVKTQFGDHSLEIERCARASRTREVSAGQASGNGQSEVDTGGWRAYGFCKGRAELQIPAHMVRPARMTGCLSYVFGGK
jgi:hypothetical protein